MIEKSYPQVVDAYAIPIAQFDARLRALLELQLDSDELRMAEETEEAENALAGMINRPYTGLAI